MFCVVDFIVVVVRVFGVFFSALFSLFCFELFCFILFGYFPTTLDLSLAFSFFSLFSSLVDIKFTQHKNIQFIKFYFPQEITLTVFPLSFGLLIVAI